MIVARLKGQLGNQMFIYAAAYAAAKDSDEELAIFRFENDILCPGFGYQLQDLQCVAYNQYKGIPARMYAWAIANFFCKLTSRFLHHKMHTIALRTGKQMEIITEKELKYHRITVDQAKSFHVLEGYWQSPRYFDHYRDELVAQFVPCFALSERTNRLLERIKNAQYPVALHVRRGDYVNIGWTLPMSYYDAAIRETDARHSDATFFVFSDDIPFVKTHLNVKGHQVEYVEPCKEAKPFEDIWAMSRCAANIIANSSFSWWGAYLNPHADKLVIAPKQMLISNADVFCEDWIILDKK